MRFMMFSKHLQSLPVREAGAAIKQLGFEGVDLTVREGGHVEPGDVREALPAAVRALRDTGLEVPHVTTSITGVKDPHATAVFEAAATLGIRELKLGYWPYRGFGTLAAGLDAQARDLEGIEQLALRTGVRANVHTHSDDYLSASGFAVWHVIKDRDPKAIGAYLDPGHLMVEGGRSGWRLSLDRCAPRLAVLAVKDFEWHRPADGASRPAWAARLVPLERGMVPWPDVFRCLKTLGFDGWVSLHSEYQGSHSWRDLSVPELIEQTRSDLVYLRQAMAA